MSAKRSDEIPFESFGENVEAHLRYAIGRDAATLLEIAWRHLRAGSWRRAILPFISAMEHVASRNPPQTGEFFTDLANVLIAGPFDEDTRFVLQQGLHAGLSWSERERQSLAAWFARVATIGDTSFAANLLQNKLPDERRPLHAIAEWLLEYGSSELLNAGRLPLVLALIAMMLESGDDTRTEVALRYLFENERRLEPGGYRDQDLAALATALDKLLQAGHVEPAVLVELARKLPDREAGELLVKIACEGDRPALRGALFVVLSGGQFQQTHAVAAWRAVLRRGLAPVAGSAFTREAARDLRDALVEWPRDDTDSAIRAQWAYVAAEQLLRLSGGRLSADDATALHRMLGRPNHGATDEAIGRALRDAGRLSRDPSLMSSLLATPSWSTVSAALALVEPAERHAEPPRWADIEGAVAACVNDALRSGSDVASPFAGWLRQARRMTWENLDGEESVVLRGDSLAVKRADVAGLTSARLSDDKLLAASALVVLHEWLHRFQHVDPQSVRTVRQAGAETTLMHLDLGADHWAAILLRKARGAYALVALKDIQGQTLPAFPVGARHTTAARSRKARRLVALRLDVLVRQLAPDRVSDDEYVFAEYGPAGGPFIILSSGPLWRVLGAAELKAKDAKTLFDAADAGASLVEIDAVLRALVQEATTPKDNS